MNYNKIIFILLLVVSILAILSCSDNGVDPDPEPQPIPGNFWIETNDSTVLSYPRGGGILVIRLNPDSVTNDTVALTIEAEPLLGTQLTETTIHSNQPVAELTILPDSTIDSATYQIILTGTDNDSIQTIAFNIPVFDTTDTDSTIFVDARNEFITWLALAHPEHGDLGAQSYFAYRYNPGMIGSVVWTFLSDEWEFRIYHPATYPITFNILLRQRGEWDAVTAARYHPDSVIYEIPVY